MLTIRVVLLAIIFTSLASGLSVAAAESTATGQARELIEQGNSHEALRLLRPLQAARAGEVEFDYVLALALLDSGAYAESTLVFERLIAANPTFHGARLDLARAYMGMNSVTKASEQLDLLDDTNPPAKARAAIVEMRKVIVARSRASRLSRYLNVATTVGYDSNVNSATVVDNFLGFDLDEQSREQESDYVEAGLNGGMRYQLSRQLSLSAGFGLQHRSNSQASFVDATVSTLNFGLARKVADDQQSLRLSIYDLQVDGEDNSRGANLSGVWLRRVTSTLNVGITADLGAIRFGDTLKVKDVDRYLAGLIATLAFGPDQQGSLALRVGYGSEEPVEAGSRYARDFGYASATMGWVFSPHVRANLSMFYQDSRYDEVFFEQQFTETRADALYRGHARVDWVFLPNWTLSHTLAYSFNDTFVDIFEYERFEAKVRINYQFR